MANRDRWVRLWSSFGFVLAATLAPATVTYAEANAPPAGYAALIDDALREYELLHFEEARALFARAHALYPNARTLRGLGMVEFELRHYAESAEFLQQALDSKERALANDLRTSTLALLERARGFIGQLTITVQPSGARVRVDGAPLADARQPIALAVGDHVIEASANGFAREQRMVTVRGGEQQQVQLELAPEAASPHAAQGEKSTPVTVPPSSGPGALPWVLVGVGGAMMIGGGVLVAIAQGDISQVEDADKGTRWSESADAYEASPLESGIGFALLGVGAAGVAGGLLWALQGGDGDSEHARNGGPRVLLGMSRISVAGTF